MFDDMISFLRSNSVTVCINILSNNNYLVIFLKQISLPLNCSFWLWKYVLTQWTSNVLTQPLWIKENNKLIPITRSIYRAYHNYEKIMWHTMKQNVSIVFSNNERMSISTILCNIALTSAKIENLWIENKRQQRG